MAPPPQGLVYFSYPDSGVDTDD